MKKREYLQAVKDAKRVLAFVVLVEDRGPVGCKITKVWARRMAMSFDGDADIKAEWLEGANGVLLVGLGYG